MRFRGLSAILIGCFLSGFVLAFLYFYWLPGIELGLPPEGSGFDGNGGASDYLTRERQQAGSAGIDQVTLSEDASIVFHTEYLDRSVSRTEVAPVDVAGLSMEEFHSLYPNWAISSFTADSVDLVKIVDDLSPELSSYLTIGIHGDQVAIFRGKPPFLKLWKTFDIYISSMMPRDIEALQNGIVVKSEAEAWTYLEGLGE